MQTHYQTLGVGEQASPDDIRRAYRKLVLLTHPDRTTDPAAHGQFLRINEAYDVLSNPARRRGYDALLWAMRNPPRRPLAPTQLQPVPGVRPRAPTPSPPRRPRAAPIDFGVYQRPIRLWGKILLVFALLVVIDYYGPTYATTATFSSPTMYDTRDDIYVVRTNKGRFLTREDPTATLALHPNATMQLRVTLLFRFVRGAQLLPVAPPLPVLFRHQALFVFTGLLLLAAGLTQGQLLQDAGRVNAIIFATAFALLVLLMIRV